MVALTEKRIARLIKAGAGRHRDSDGPIRGLHLQVTKGGTASWLLRYEVNGRERWHGLGPIGLVSLKMARERGRTARLQLLDGQDPLEIKRAERTKKAIEAARTIAFGEAARQYLDQHSRKWSSAKHSSQWTNSLKNYILPVIGKLPVATIDTAIVLQVLEQLVRDVPGEPAVRFWDARPETASRVRGRIESVLDWATVRGYRSGENPARWTGYLDQVLPARDEIQKTRHFAALPYSDIPAFMAELREQHGVAARALEFLILCASRTGEVLGATWTEIDLGQKLWTIPETRMKSGREHVVPLSDAALDVLRYLPREQGNPCCFIGQRGGGLSNSAMIRTLGRLRKDCSVHGFRSSFRVWCGEQTNFPRDVAEMALAHVVGNAVERAYARGDLIAKRRRLMAEWAKFCGTNPQQAATGGTVVAMRG